MNLDIDDDIQNKNEDNIQATTYLEIEEQAIPAAQSEQPVTNSATGTNGVN